MLDAKSLEPKREGFGFSSSVECRDIREIGLRSYMHQIDDLGTGSSVISLVTSMQYPCQGFCVILEKKTGNLSRLLSNRWGRV
ncbi:hypothetical protein HBI56_091990 [Parastagonospora nodorum]|nr:hypothetical protein HBH53_139140 [Parastagonospora nodorum]KAH3998118.1 hypothetical protein HBI10_134070 [Parastagonospora nodorum]KAH4029842.1 hypothetical protein HBI13_033530 [Parastagonospora nodorum]KAH4034081.1 hypothetical protein HBI09_105890 [Parastagonospora nodorum]KAH4186249.1 hypothetical protein HBI95_240690 [Parastagonospora nodorum]